MDEVLRRRAAVLLVVAALLGAGALGASARMTRRHDTTTAEDQLFAARWAVANATSFHYDYEVTVSADAPGASDHAAGDGAWDGRPQDLATARPATPGEVVGLYRRLVADVPDVQQRQMLTAVLALDVYLGDIEAGGLEPSAAGLRQAIGDLALPTTVESTDAVTTLGATLRAKGELVEALRRPLPLGRVQLDLDDHDLPTTLRLDVGASGLTIHAVVNFSAWNTTN